MSKLNKEEVLELFSTAYLAAHGKQPEIEQKSGWYKVDGGKSVRLADLVDMATALKSDATANVSSKPAAAKPAVKAKPMTKTKPKAGASIKAKSSGGMNPKTLWAQKNVTGCRLPRGF